MLKRSNLEVMVTWALCSGLIFSALSIVSRGVELITFGIIGGGIIVAFMTVHSVLDDQMGMPIPFRMLRSRKLILVKRIDSSRALISASSNPDHARFVEGVPTSIAEGETFILEKGGLVTIVARCIKEEKAVY